MTSTTPHKKHGWHFWCAITLFVLPVLYVASFGPACWILQHHPDQTHRVAFLFEPILRVVKYGNQWLREPMAYYGESCGGFTVMVDLLLARRLIVDPCHYETRLDEKSPVP